MNFLKSK